MNVSKHTILSLFKAALVPLLLICLLLLAQAPGRAARPATTAGDVARPAGFDQDAFHSETLRAVNISQHWATLLCKFADVAAEPQHAAFFDGMFEQTGGPSLSDYWREVSYGHIPAITTDVYGWFSLLHDRTHYNYSETTADYDAAAIVQDCVDAANASVNFAPYTAVAVFLNSPSPVAITSLYTVDYPDGAQIALGAITIPSNKYNLALVAHEMGHAYGLPHSFADGIEYQNPWDLMGIASTYRCSVNADPVYGCLGQHLIAHYKDYLGWMLPALKFETPQGEHTITLERLARPETDNYRLATIFTGRETFVVEARQRVGYDAKLAGDAVIIHRGRGDDLVDIDGSPYDDAGAMWLPGETYSDPASGISIRVDEATPSGFVVTINNRNALRGIRANLVATPRTPVTNEQVDFTAELLYQDPDYLASTGVVFSATLPADLTYLPGSLTVDNGIVVSEDPLVVQSFLVFNQTAIHINFSATVNGDLTEPTPLAVPVEIGWGGGSLDTEYSLIANGESVFLPVLRR